MALAAAAAAALAGCATTVAGDGAAPLPADRTTSLAASTPDSPTASAPTASDPTSTAASPVTQSRPRTTPCSSNTRPKWVLVSVRRQHLWMCAGHRVARETPITSGMLGQYTETPRGTYVIQGKTRDTSLTLLSGATYAVKYWIPFDGPLFGFHDSSWQDFPYGSPKYKTAGSHGCVHMPLAAIRFLYQWADVGTPVRIKG